MAERLCYGAQDAAGSPDCDGPDPQPVHVEGWDGAEPFDTVWCSECRKIAAASGAKITLAQENAK